MTNGTISEKCETLYNKLNAFVTSVISRDVTPKISNLNTEVWGSDTQTGNSRIDTLNTNFNNLDGSITSMESDINNVKSDINNVNSDINTIESDVSNLQTSVNSLSDSITNHTTTFTGMIEKHAWSIPAFSLESGKGVQKTVTVPNPSGYYRIPLIQGAYKCYASSLSLSGNTLTVKIQNHYSSNANASMYGIILYFKSSIIKEI